MSERCHPPVAHGWRCIHGTHDDNKRTRHCRLITCIYCAAIVGTFSTTYSFWPLDRIGSAVVIDPVSYCEFPFQVWKFIKLMMQSYKSSQRRFSLSFSAHDHFDLPSTLPVVLTTEPRRVSTLQAHGPNPIITCVVSVNPWLLAYSIQYSSNIGVQWRSVTT